MTTSAKPKAAAEEPAISSMTIAHTTIAALDADPLFRVVVDKGTEPKLVQSLASVSMGMLVSFLMPYIKAALISFLQEGTVNPTASQVLSKAHELAESQAKEVKEAKA